MKRELCGMAPSFSNGLRSNTRVELTLRNRKGKIKRKIQGVIIINHGSTASLRYFDEYGDKHVYWIKAKDIYYGRHNLRFLTPEEWIEYDKKFHSEDYSEM